MFIIHETVCLIPLRRCRKAAEPTPPKVYRQKGIPSPPAKPFARSGRVWFAKRPRQPSPTLSSRPRCRNLLLTPAKIVEAMDALTANRHGTGADYVHYINGPDTLPPPLSREEEQKVFEAIRAGKEGARDPLITHNLRLVVYIAKKFESPGASQEDLISIGTIGLIKAVNTFRVEKNIKLATYASRCIENEILMFLRKSAQLKNEISLDDPLHADPDGNELSLSDLLGSDPDIIHRDLEQAAEKQQLLEAVDRLPNREKEIMAMRFGLCGKKAHTQKEAADVLGISQSYISRLEKRILKRLRTELEKIA